MPLLLSAAIALTATQTSAPAAALSNTCAASVQPLLQSGLIALYDFEYAESLDAFEKASVGDPHCAIADWGAAMTHWHELWSQASEEDLRDGWKAAQSGEAREQYASPRERAYVEAIAAYFRPPANVRNERTADERADAYLAKMRALHAAYPGDPNGSVFLALAILAANDRGTREERLARDHEAGALLQPIFDADPATVGPARAGAAHYLIHAYDAPELAGQGLAAARAYAKIAPDSPHALHMPSHIFAQLGLWGEDIASNVASYDAAKSQAGHAMEKAHEELHALDYLQYALLQTSQFGKSAEMTSTAVQIAKFHPGDNSQYTLLWLPVRQVMEEEDWQNARAIAPPPDTADAYWKALYAWFQVDAAAHLHDTAAAQANLQELKKLAVNNQQLNKSGDKADMAVLLPEAEGWSAVSRGDYATAIAQMKLAAAEEAKPGNYGSFRKPAEEMLADVYRMSGDMTAAHAAYLECLSRHPHRRLSTLGIAATAAPAVQNEH